MDPREFPESFQGRLERGDSDDPEQMFCRVARLLRAAVLERSRFLVRTREVCPQDVCMWS